MSKELQSLCRMMIEGDPELRCAAARVLAELKPANPEVIESFRKALETDNLGVQAHVVDAIGRYGKAKAARFLVPLLEGPDPVRRRTVSALAALGPEAVAHMSAELKRQSPEIRQGIIEAFAQIPGRIGTDALLNTLPDSDPEQVRLICQHLQEKIPALSTEEKGHIYSRTEEVLKKSQGRRDAVQAVAATKIFGFLRLPQALRHLLHRVSVKENPSVRRNALISLSRLQLDGKQDNLVLQKLLPLLDEDDFTNVVSHAIAAVERIRLTAGAAKKIANLLDSRYLGVRLFAIKSLGRIGTVAEAPRLLAILEGEPTREQEAAVEALRTNKAFAPALLKAIKKATNPSLAWALARLLRYHRDVLPAAALRPSLTSCIQQVSRGDDRFRLAFEVVRNARPAMLQQAMLKAARSARATHKLDRAEKLLTLVNTEDLATMETRFELALIRLRKQKKSPGEGLSYSAPFAEPNSALVLLSTVLRSDRFPLAKHLKAEHKFLKPEDYLYLGLHFAERSPAERELATQMLRFLARQYPRNKEGKVAKRRLQAQGIAL